VRLTIERLGHHGDGVAAGPVYVPMALPGEVVEAEVEGDRARDVRIVQPSHDRVAAECRHFRSCGGCAVQHWRAERVDGWKAGIVRQALAAQGLEALVETLHVSPPASRRRATLAGRRTKGGAVVGFHGRASGSIVEVPDCRLLRPELLGALPVLAAITVAGGSRAAGLDLALTLTDTGLALDVTGGKTADRALTEAVARAAGGALARVTWSGETLLQAEVPVVRIGRAEVHLPPGAFLQPTAEGEAALVRAVRSVVGPAARVADLFAGLGTFTFPLAETAEVVAVEGEAAMIAALGSAARRTSGLRSITTERRDLFRRPLDAGELDRFDAVVLDPPRAGAEAQAIALSTARVPLVAYVSCNPATFARDARHLVAGGYRLDRVALVDQFRWSPHVELVARLIR